LKKAKWYIERELKRRELPNDLGNRRDAFGASVLTDGLAGKRTE
jgi:hypothetical protein